MRVLFMGTPAFAVPTLQALAEAYEVAAVVTRPDKGRGRGRRTAFSEVKQWALEAGLPVEQPRTLRDEEVQTRLAAYEPDVIVVAAYGLILPREILDMPRFGCVNVHASLLPRHRGAAPVAWAILCGDAETGITTMLMDEGLDTGPMLLRRAMPLGPRATTGEVTQKLAVIGAELLVETLAAIDAGNLTPQPQPQDGASLAPSLKKSDGAVDWAQSAAAVDRQVRAFQPWPGTFTFRAAERLVLWDVVALDLAHDVAPGTVIGASPEGIRVACGEGAVDVLALQRAGGRRQTTAEFLRGHPIAPGERFRPEAL